MKHVYWTIWCAVIIVGCAVSDDPNKGGLLGYVAHHDEYQDRLDKKQQTLNELEKEQAQALQEDWKLDAEKSAILNEVVRQQNLLTELEFDIETLEHALGNYRAGTAQQQQETDALAAKARVLKDEVRIAEDETLAQTQTSDSVQQREQRIRELREHVEQLLLLASEL